MVDTWMQPCSPKNVPEKRQSQDGKSSSGMVVATILSTVTKGDVTGEWLKVALTHGITSLACRETQGNGIPYQYMKRNDANILEDSLQTGREHASLGGSQAKHRIIPQTHLAASKY